MTDPLLDEAARIRTRSGRTAEVVGLLADRLDVLQRIVHRLAIDRPFGVTPKVGSLYCTLCGAIEGAGDEHQAYCAWRLAREAEGLDAGWPRVPARVEGGDRE